MRKIKVLFLAANPSGTPHLNLDEEVRQIEARIRATKYPDSIQLLSKWAVRSDDLLQYLLQHQPHIVHFSGHGSTSERIVLLDQDGTPKPVPKKALLNLFTVLKDNIRVVILNACYSRPQAKAITEVIDCAIGMKQAIGDSAAIAFAAAFYQAIGFGRSVQEAFDLGTTSLQLQDIPEDDTPQLILRAGFEPSALTLIGPKASSPTQSPPMVEIPPEKWSETNRAWSMLKEKD